MKKPAFRTARCILRQDDLFFMVIHQSFPRGKGKKWGLPGGRIERHETSVAAARRELREELGVRIEALTEVGDYRYKGHRHQVFGTEFDGTIASFDRAEISKIGWHSLDAIRQFEAADLLHAGFELRAIQQYCKLENHRE